MRWTKTGRVLFFIFCLEFGVYLVVAPWSPTWDQAVMHLPVSWLRDVYFEPWTRGAMTGLGLAYLLLAAHDLNDYLAERSGHGGS
jgi:hypothetical protein